MNVNHRGLILNLGCVITDTWSCLTVSKLQLVNILIPESQARNTAYRLEYAMPTKQFFFNCSALGSSVNPGTIRAQELLIKHSDSVVITECVPIYFGYEHYMQGQGKLGYPRERGILPYMGYIGMWGYVGYGFQYCWS